MKAGMITGAMLTPVPVYAPPPVRVAAQPSVINGGPFLHAVAETTPGCSEYTVSVHEANYGQVRGKPALSGHPLWQLITGSHVTICSKDIKTDEHNIPWIWVQFKSQEEPWDHEGYMSFRILEPSGPPRVAITPSPAPPPPPLDKKAEAENPQAQLAPGPDQAQAANPGLNQEPAVARQPRPVPNAAIVANQMIQVFRQMFPGSVGGTLRFPNQEALVPNLPPPETPGAPTQTPYHGGLPPSEAGTYEPPSSVFPSAPGGQADSNLSRSSAAQSASTRTVEVTASGDTADAAEKEAARQAVQQVAGVFIDARRRFEMHMSDQKADQIVEEKILSYTNAYVSEFKVLSSDSKNGVYTIAARVTVKVAPLLKTLQANNVPTTVFFDSNSGGATAETEAEEKRKALELYRDLVSRLDNLLQIGIGKAEVSSSIPSAPNSAWISVPITYFANKDAMREWHDKFALFADKRARLRIDTSERRVGDCSVPTAQEWESETFLGVSPGSGQTGVAACFISGATPRGLIADCFGRAFVLQTAALGHGRADTDLSISQRARLIRLVVDFIDKDGGTVYSLELPFKNFPSIAIENPRSAPQPGEKAFFNYCVGNQGIFFSSHTGNVGSRAFGFGDTIIFPTPGSRINGFLNVLLPNDKIGQIDKIRASLKSEP